MKQFFDVPTVSVIIPAFNAAHFIAETLKSVIDQSLRDIEIVVVDDGSTDNTWHIIKSFNDSRIHAFQKKNGGVSSARNFGLERIRGRYVQFLDADDILDIRKLELQSKRLADAGDDCISTSRWGWFVCETSDVHYVPGADWTDLQPNEFAILKFGGGGMMPPNTWMIPRSLIGSLRFHSSVDTFEDGLFLAEMLRRSRYVVFSGDAVSFYRKQNPASLTAQYDVENCLRSYISCSMIADHMLLLNDDVPMRVAAANLLLKCALRSLPLEPSVALLAERRAIGLGEPSFDPRLLGGKFEKVAKIIGWRRAAVYRHYFIKLRKLFTRANWFSTVAL